MALSKNDASILEQIFDPESAPSTGVLVDASLPKDPHVRDDVAFTAITEHEKLIIKDVEAALTLESPAQREQNLSKAVERLQELLSKHSSLGCLHNDLAQGLRLLHGDNDLSRSLIDATATSNQGGRTLAALSAAVDLLNPSSPQTAVSPMQCRTLAQAHMQRAALYRSAAKQLKLKSPAAQAAWKDWTVLDFEEAASRDFFMGGRYGNEIGKVMAVHTNPTAKLCGQMVQDALRREMTQES